MSLKWSAWELQYLAPFLFSRIALLANMASNNDSPEEEEFSMVDVLEEDNELEEEANAVLGGSDDQNCTYPTVRKEDSYRRRVTLNIRKNTAISFL